MNDVLSVIKADVYTRSISMFFLFFLCFSVQCCSAQLIPLPILDQLKTKVARSLCMGINLKTRFYSKFTVYREECFFECSLGKGAFL